jgi:hypothetical protein
MSWKIDGKQIKKYTVAQKQILYLDSFEKQLIEKGSY